jgi:hypothetical protein
MVQQIHRMTGRFVPGSDGAKLLPAIDMDFPCLKTSAFLLTEPAKIAGDFPRCAA